MRRKKNHLLGMLLIAIGLFFLGWAYSTYQSLTSKVSNFFSGTPSDETLIILAIGVVSLLAGLYLYSSKFRK